MRRGTLPKPPPAEDGNLRYMPERIPAASSTAPHAAAVGVVPHHQRLVLEDVSGSRPPPPPPHVLPREQSWKRTCEGQRFVPDGMWQAKGAEILPCGSVRERVPASRPPPRPTGFPPPQPARGNAPHGYPAPPSRNSSVSSLGGRPPAQPPQHIPCGSNPIVPLSRPLPQPPPPSSCFDGSLETPQALRRDPPPAVDPYLSVSPYHQQRSVARSPNLEEEPREAVDEVHAPFNDFGGMNVRSPFPSDYRISDDARGSCSSTGLVDMHPLRRGDRAAERSPSLASRSASRDELGDGPEPSQSTDEDDTVLTVQQRNVRASRTHTRWGDVLMANTKQGKRASKCYSKWAVSL